MSVSRTNPQHPQTTGEVLMVRPANFFGNPETLADNAFQQSPASTPRDVQSRALREFNGVVAALRARGIAVRDFQDQPQDETPDSLFPNNWFSTHAGTLVLYPMMAPSRRRERKPEIIAWLERRYANTIDLTHFESRGEFLEGTGSLVLDHVQKVAYAGLSGRTHARVVKWWGEQSGYRIEAFPIADSRGVAIYHTNVMMSIGSAFAVIAPDTIVGASERNRALTSLRDSGRAIIELTLGEMHAFAANVLELHGASGPLVAISQRAWDGLAPTSRSALEAAAEPLIVDVSTIEQFGGGGVRCMLAELF